MIHPKISRTLKVMMIMAICTRCVDGKLLVQPRNTVAMVGDLTYFNCSTGEPEEKILWLNGEQYVYAGDKILNFYAKRFSVELDNKTGSCNLVIRNVTVEDAGSYSCKDVKDINNPGDAALTVLESGPLCRSNVKSDGLLGPNDCNIVPEVFNLSCSVTYHGNTPPTLHWKSVNGHTPAITSGEHCKVLSNDTSKGGKAECDMTVKTELNLHNSFFVCQTNSSAIEQYNCTTDPIKVLYAFSSFHVIEKAIDETVKCSVNSTAQCNYKWLLNNTVIDEGSSTVTLHRSGVHRCEAMCDMRGSHCSVTAMMVHVNTGPEPKTGASPSTLAIVFIVLFVLSIVSIIFLLLYLLRSRSERRRINGENLELNISISNSSKMERSGVTDPLLNTKWDELRSKLEAMKSELVLKNKVLEDQQKELEYCKRELREKNVELADTNLEISGTAYVLITGLSDGSRIMDEVLKINLQSPSEMYHVEEVPVHMTVEATAAVYHNTVYVVGLGTYANQICKYESKSGWKECASLIQGRRKHSAAFVGEVLYICGGFFDKDESVLDSVEAYNAFDDTCENMGKLVIPVESSGNCVAYKKSLYIFGGADKHHKAISDAQVYDTVQNTCRLLSKPMRGAQRLMRAALWRESVILLGHRNCFIYDFSTEVWQLREEYKTNVTHFGLALSNDRVYVIGGGSTETGAKGLTWTCSDDVRSVAIEEIIENKPAEWKVHCRLPRPCLVQAFAVVRELTT